MELLSQLTTIVGANHVLTSKEHLAGFTTDFTKRWTSHPLAVVRPANTEQVSQVVNAAREAGVSITPQGGNTSLVGGGIGSDGGLLVSTSRLQKWSINPVTRALTAGSGLTLADAQHHATEHGLIFPINTASRDSATLGGIIATNAGGTRAIRWGTTRKQLLGLEVVLSDGSVVRREQALTRDNVGYDLPQLFAGSEGTLGIITEAVFLLQPVLDTNTVVILAPVENFIRGNDIVVAAKRKGFNVEAAEFFTHTGAQLVSETSGIPIPFPDEKYTILIEISTSHPEPFTLLEEVLSPNLTSSQFDRVIVEEPPAAKLWQLREGHTEAINKTTKTPVIKLDISVPIDSLDKYVAEVTKVVSNFAPARAICFGHFAEGNVHTNILDSAPEDYAAISTAVFELVTELSGSISAEHGIGRAKNQWLPLARTPEDLKTMKAIRTTLDPHGLFAPELLQF